MRIDPKSKQPYAIALKDESMFAFAGLSESWKDKATGERLCTYTIVTTDPNELVEPLDNRMPVILGSKDYDRWLAPVDAAHLPVDLLRPFPADRMTAWKVSRAVGNVKNDDPSLIAPIGSLTGNEEMLPPFQIMLPGSRFQKAVGGDG